MEDTTVIGFIFGGLAIVFIVIGIGSTLLWIIDHVRIV